MLTVLACFLVLIAILVYILQNMYRMCIEALLHITYTDMVLIVDTLANPWVCQYTGVSLHGCRPVSFLMLFLDLNYKLDELEEDGVQ